MPRQLSTVLRQLSVDEAYGYDVCKQASIMNAYLLFFVSCFSHNVLQEEVHRHTYPPQRVVVYNAFFAHKRHGQAPVRPSNVHRHDQRHARGSENVKVHPRRPFSDVAVATVFAELPHEEGGEEGYP